MSQRGVELVIHPLLPGIKQLKGERLKDYLASELRDRIRKNNVKIKIKDRYSRKEHVVEPRQFSGRLIHDLHTHKTGSGEIYLEIYLNSLDSSNQIGLYRGGTRVLKDITILDPFNREPCSGGYLQGMIDAPFLNLTPGTRDGVIRDESFVLLVNALA